MKTIRIRGLVVFAILYLLFKNGYAQQTPTAPAYPLIVGFFAVFVPIGTISNNGYTGNFTKSSTIGIPFGLNILKSDHLGYSLEFVSLMNSQNGTTKVNFVLFHPGVMIRFPNGFTIIPRLAFETDGRYGFTPVFSKIILREKDYQFYVSLSEPMRYGNNLPSTYTTALQLGINF